MSKGKNEQEAFEDMFPSVGSSKNINSVKFDDSNPAPNSNNTGYQRAVFGRRRSKSQGMLLPGKSYVDDLFSSNEDNDSSLFGNNFDSLDVDFINNTSKFSPPFLRENSVDVNDNEPLPEMREVSSRKWASSFHVPENNFNKLSRAHSRPVSVQRAEFNDYSMTNNGNNDGFAVDDFFISNDTLRLNKFTQGNQLQAPILSKGNSESPSGIYHKNSPNMSMRLQALHNFNQNTDAVKSNLSSSSTNANNSIIRERAESDFASYSRQSAAGYSGLDFDSLDYEIELSNRVDPRQHSRPSPLLEQMQSFSSRTHIIDAEYNDNTGSASPKHSPSLNSYDPQMNALQVQQMNMMLHNNNINSQQSSMTGTTQGDWICASCGNTNYSWRHVCNMRKCRAPKPGHLTVEPTPPGAWACLSCGNMNYAERMVCNMRKCRAPRPDMQLQYGFHNVNMSNYHEANQQQVTSPKLHFMQQQQQHMMDHNAMAMNNLGLNLLKSNNNSFDNLEYQFQQVNLSDNDVSASNFAGQYN